MTVHMTAKEILGEWLNVPNDGDPMIDTLLSVIRAAHDALSRPALTVSEQPETKRDDNIHTAPERFAVVHMGRSTWQGPASDAPKKPADPWISNSPEMKMPPLSFDDGSVLE